MVARYELLNRIFVPFLPQYHFGSSWTSCSVMQTRWGCGHRTQSLFAEFCRRAHLSVKIEVGQGLSRVHSNSRPADVLVNAWERAKPAAFDIKVTSPLTPATLHDACNSAGVATYTAECQSTPPMTQSVRSEGGYVFLLRIRTTGTKRPRIQSPSTAQRLRLCHRSIISL